MFLLVLAVMIALLFEIRNETRRTAEAIERLAAQQADDDRDAEP